MRKTRAIANGLGLAVVIDWRGAVVLRCKPEGQPAVTTRPIRR